MKIASNVFSIIGIIANIAIAGYNSGTGFGFIYWILAGLCIIFAICGISSQEKSVGLGICLILFVNPLSGIFYLCWDGR